MVADEYVPDRGEREGITILLILIVMIMRARAAPLDAGATPGGVPQASQRKAARGESALLSKSSSLRQRLLQTGAKERSRLSDRRP